MMYVPYSNASTAKMLYINMVKLLYTHDMTKKCELGNDQLHEAGHTICRLASRQRTEARKHTIWQPKQKTTIRL